MKRKIVIIVLSILFSAKSNICYAEQYEQISQTNRIGDPQEALAFVEETYKDYLVYHREEKLGPSFSMTDEEIDKLTVGKGFYIYNVDGKQQQAILFYPLYEGEKCRWILEMAYQEGKWVYEIHYDPFGFILVSDINTKALTELDYAGKESICYSINNQVYMENEDNKVLLEEAYEKGGDVYSKEELEFMNMDFEQKKALYDKGYEELYDVKYCDIGDDDPDKQLVGGEYPEESESERRNSEKNETQKNSISTAVAGIIVMVFGAAAVKIWMRKEGEI